MWGLRSKNFKLYFKSFLSTKIYWIYKLIIEKSKRFIEYEKLKDLLNVDKKNLKFVSVLVNPTNEILEKIKRFKF